MIRTDLGERQEWRAVRAFDNQFTLTFLNSGVAFDTSGYEFTVNIRKIGSQTNLIELGEGTGITNGGLSGIVEILLDEASSDINPKGYFYEIVYTVGSFTNRLLQGTLNIIQDYNDGNINTSVTLEVNLSGTDITLNISQSGITQSELDTALALKADLNTRVSQTTSTATLTPDIDSYDLFEVIAQAAGITIANPTGTPSNGNGFVIRLTDNGTARAIAFGNMYRAFGSALPTTTTINKTMYIAVVYNYTDLKYDVLSTIQEV